MRSFEIPEVLKREFAHGMNRLDVFGFPNAELVVGDEFPNTYLHIFLEGVESARRNGDDPSFRITSSGSGSPWIRTSLELLEVSPFKEMFARATELYQQSEDYHRFPRFPRLQHR